MNPRRRRHQRIRRKRARLRAFIFDLEAARVILAHMYPQEEVRAAYRAMGFSPFYGPVADA